MYDLTAENIIFQRLSAHFLQHFQDLRYTLSALILCIFNGLLAQVFPAVHSEDATVQD